jgi:hypothetical protein
MFALDIAVIAALVSTRPRRTVGRTAASNWQLEASISAPIVLFGALFGAGSLAFGSPARALAWASANPVLLEEEAIDLGTCDVGSHRRVEFMLRNRGDKPVRIVGGTTTCRCIATGGLPVVIPAGEVRSVPVDVTVLGKGPDFRQSVTMFADGNVLRILQGMIVATVIEPDVPDR